MNILSKIKYSFLMTFIIAFWIAFDLYIAITYRESLNIGMVTSILETNFIEAKEMIFDVGLGYFILFIFIIAVVVLSSRELKSFKFSITKSLLTLLFIVITPLTLNFFYSVKSKYKKEDFAVNCHEIICSYTVGYMPIIIGDIALGVLYYVESNQIKNFNSREKILPEGIIFNKEKSKIKKIFFVIGESSNRDHYSLYGYDIPTTPFLNSLKNEKAGKFSFYNAISPACMTTYAVPFLLCFDTPHNLQRYLVNKSLFDLASDAGYQTLWLSNQGTSALWETKIRTLKEKADYKYNTKIEQDDLSLIPLIKANYNKEKQQLFVIQLSGSHTPYDFRFDKIDEKAIKTSSNNLSYDRSVHHTDRVFNEIYNIMKQDTSSVMYYVSDHGQIVKPNFGAHGLFNASPNVDQFKVPLITVNNSSIDINATVNKYIDNETNLINIISTINIIAELLGYTISEERILDTLSEGKYVLHANRKVYLFDQVLKEELE